MSYPPQGYGPPQSQTPPPAPPSVNITMIVTAAIVVAGGVIGVAIFTSNRGAAVPLTTQATVAPPSAAPAAPVAPPAVVEPLVEVNCVNSGQAIACSVEHRAGERAVSACWDVVFICQNGTRMVAHACQPVQPHATANRVILESAFTNLQRCDNVASTSVENTILELL